MSLEILHLEDFSNEVDFTSGIMVDNQPHGHYNAPDLFNYLGTYSNMYFGNLMRILPWGNSNNNQTSLISQWTPKIRLIPSGGKFKAVLHSNNSQGTGFMLQLNLSLLPTTGKISLSFNFDCPEAIEMRMFTGGWLTLSNYFMYIPDRSGKIEIVVDGMEASVYTRGKRLGVIGRLSLQANIQVYMRFPVNSNLDRTVPHVTLSDLSLVHIKDERQRLGNTKVVRVPVAHVDDLVEPDDGPLNGLTPLDDNPLVVTETPVTVDFRIPETVVKGDILGAQLVVAATNTETGSHVKVDTLNGETELSTKTTELTSTIDARIPIYSPNLGTKLDDYSDLKLKVSAIEV